jgi:hypothetical protein
MERAIDERAPHARARGRAVKRVLLALGIGAALCGGAELAVRWLVFGRGDLARRLGKDLRRPGVWSDPLEDDYWKLQYLIRDRGRARASQMADEELGWAPPPVDLEAVRAELGGRRLVVLYGDSYARCLTTPEECWQGLLERSPLGQRFGLLNLGVAGYSLGQTYLLLRRSLDELAELDPLVAIGIYLDEDLDRCTLSIHRLPQPRFRVEEGELVEPGPVLVDLEEFVEANPPSFRSFAWRLVERRLLPRAWSGPAERQAAALEEKRALARALVAAIQELLEARGVEHFFVLFHGEQTLRGASWQEDLLQELFRERGLRFVSSRWPLAAAPPPSERYFGGHPRLAGHYNAEGNRVVFRCLEDALLGRFAGHGGEPPPAGRSLLELFEPAACTLRGAGALASPGRGLHGPFEAAEDETRLVLRPGAGGPTVVRFDLGGRFRSLRALAKAGGGERSDGAPRAVELLLRIDGRLAERVRIEPGAAARPLEVDLLLARELELVAALDGSEAPRAEDWIYLASPTLD